MIRHIVRASEVVVWLHLAQDLSAVIPERSFDVRDKAVYSVGCSLDIVVGVVMYVFDVSG